MARLLICHTSLIEKLIRMTIGSNKGFITLFLGDIFVLAFAFFLALVVRNAAIPDIAALSLYLPVLLPLSVLWIFTFFIAGLYDKRVFVFEKKLPSIILNAQIANSLIAVIFFYTFASYLTISPKTIIILYLIISTVLLFLWRVLGSTFIGVKRQEHAILIGEGEEMQALKEEVNAHKRYNLEFASSVDLKQIDGIDFKTEIINLIYSENISSVVIDLRNEKSEAIIPSLYNLIFSGVRFYDMYKVYEEVFGRIPLSLIKYSWFLENISSTSRAGYDILKRTMDIAIGSVLFVVSLPFYLFVTIAIKIEDGGNIFILQERVGQNNRLINIRKFRSMTGNDQGDYGAKGVTELRVTNVGRFLRVTRIDELPQLWNVLKGDISLIGPRPELPKLVALYEKEIPYYSVRHLVKPGLSGWAQIYHENHPHHGTEVLATREKLSYDLYYIKNRSLILDIMIALKTIKTLLSRSGN